MTNTTNPQDLCNRIEHLVEEYISTTRAAARAALDGAFAAATTPSTRPSRPTTGATARARTGSRRAADEIGALSERLYEAVCRTPGETMTVIAPVVGATARELNRPMARLKQAGRVRSVGTRHATRYFPMARDAQRASA
jgi:cytochrome c5